VMSHIQAVTWASEKHRKQDLRRRQIAEFKFSIYMAAYKYFWRALHFTRLSRPYSRMMCRLNLYQKFPDGRCQWCGNNHAPQTQGKEWVNDRNG
jgi:hypothetical protein